MVLQRSSFIQYIKVLSVALSPADLVNSNSQFKLQTYTVVLCSSPCLRLFSPFRFSVLPTHEASKVRASGPGLSSSVPASFPAEFNVDATAAGEAQLSVLVTVSTTHDQTHMIATHKRNHHSICPSSVFSVPPQDQDGKPKQASIHDNGDGTYQVSYIPDRVERYAIVIKYGGDNIPASPFKVQTKAKGDASKCIVTGSSPHQRQKYKLYKIKNKSIKTTFSPVRSRCRSHGGHRQGARPGGER